MQAGDGYFGWPEKGPFDVMVIKEAIDHVPPPLLQQLKRGGRMVIPLGPAGGPQYLTLVTRDAGGQAERAPDHAGALLAAPGRRADLSGQRPSRYQAKPRVPSSSKQRERPRAAAEICEAPVTR